jgi:putative endonuclease
MRGVGNRFVYILRSKSDPRHHYVGITSDVDQRLEWHNHGPSGWTVDHRPWSVVVTNEFQSEHAAVDFEKYLKSGSGRAFTRRHFAAKPEGQKGANGRATLDWHPAARCAHWFSKQMSPVGGPRYTATTARILDYRVGPFVRPTPLERGSCLNE